MAVFGHIRPFADRQATSATNLNETFRKAVARSFERLVGTSYLSDSLLECVIVRPLAFVCFCVAKHLNPGDANVVKIGVGHKPLVSIAQDISLFLDGLLLGVFHLPRRLRGPERLL